MSTTNFSKDSSPMKNQDILSTLKEMFPQTEINYVLYPYHGPVHVFDICFNNVEELKNEWNNVSNAIAVHFQTGLKTEFEIWNLYLLYRCNFEVPKGIRYKIENDTISSRKIIIDVAEMTAFGSEVEGAIARHITNMDLKLLTRQQMEAIKSENFNRDNQIVSSLAAVVNTSKKANEEYYNEVLAKFESAIQ